MTIATQSEQLEDAWNLRRSDMRRAFHLATNVLQSLSSEEITDETAHCHKILGYCYWRFSEFSLSMEHSLKALNYYQSTHDLRGEADTLNSLGAVYMFQKQHEKRLECNLKCLEIRQQLGNADDISGSMNNIGETYLEAGDYSSAKQWFYDCISFPGSTADSLAWAYHNLGKLFLIEGNFAESSASFLKSLDLADAIKYEVLITETYLQLAQLNKEEGFNLSAKEWANKALELAQVTGAKEEQKNAFFLLSEVKEKEGLFNEALNDFKNYHALFSEIHNESNIQRLKDLEFQYQLENIKKEAEIERLKTVDLKLAYDKIEQQKSLLELRNKEIVESIRYAQRIQQAVLKEEHHVSEHLPEHFIFYRPKDIVSGDFYWAQEKEGVLYVAAADCTGHGVPGGFLTMLGIAFLNEIISKNEIQTPAQILNELRAKFIHELGLQDSTNDGMDITLVSLRYDEPTDSKELMWAGAYNPLWIVKNQGKSINTDFTPALTIDQLGFYEVKPDKQPIGKSDYQADFTNHTLNLEKGDMLYLFSDGYQDQFGGDAGKKLKKSGFKELILSLAEKSLENQLSTMNDFFDSWKGDHEQVDDVCVIGIKL
ncbi:MAG: tetratricopeptide repeat protein [Bacteroidota bacterium]